MDSSHGNFSAYFYDASMAYFGFSRLLFMPGIIRKAALVLSLLLYLSGTLPVYAQSFEKQTALAELTLDLARFTTWPEHIFNKQSPTLNLCVVGDHLVQLSFARIDKKRVKNKILQVINLSRLRNLSQCHLIYISQLEHKVMRQVLMELKNMPILTVGKNMQLIKDGGMVAFAKMNGKIQININLSIIRQSGLVVSSRILKLATLYNFAYPED